MYSQKVRTDPEGLLLRVLKRQVGNAPSPLLKTTEGDSSARASRGTKATFEAKKKSAMIRENFETDFMESFYRVRAGRRRLFLWIFGFLGPARSWSQKACFFWGCCLLGPEDLAIEAFVFK